MWKFVKKIWMSWMAWMKYSLHVLLLVSTLRRLSGDNEDLEVSFQGAELLFVGHWPVVAIFSKTLSPLRKLSAEWKYPDGLIVEFISANPFIHYSDEWIASFLWNLNSNYFLPWIATQEQCLDERYMNMAIVTSLFYTRTLRIICRCFLKTHSTLIAFPPKQ